MNIRKKIIPLVLLSAIVLAGCYANTKVPTADEMTAEEVGMMTEIYQEYTPELEDKYKGSQKFVLFFHADWCPTCRVLEKKIKENLTSLATAIILETNYDREVEVKKKYKVRVQSTVVFFNADGSIEKTKVNPRLQELIDFFS